MQSAQASWRQQLAAFVESPGIEKFIIGLILINAVTLGMETSDAIMSRYGTIIRTIDGLIVSVFVIEISLRITAHGRAFFKDPWSVFDFTVVAIAVVPASSQFSVLRALRVLRVLRLLTMVPQMRRVVGALLSAIPGLSTIIMVLLLIFYVFAVIATNLFGDQYADWFGSIGSSMYTLFQVMTLESWSMGIVRPVMAVYPDAWLFFLPFILIATFAMLNLFIGIIVDTMQTMHSAEHASDREHIEEAVHADSSHIETEVRALREEIRALRQSLAKASNLGG